MRSHPLPKGLRPASPLVLLLLTLAVPAFAEEPAKAFRPPSVPLVACDPYFSVWSNADHLNDDVTRHWTGKPQPLSSLIRIDGTTFRLMGDEPKTLPPLPQTALQVLPTRTLYQFEGSGVRVSLTFMTPSLPDDLDVFARPLTYLTWDVSTTDNQPHAAQLMVSVGAALAVNTPDQPVTWARESVGPLTVLRVGSQDQEVLRKKGDDLRIDWGHAYLAADGSQALGSAGDASALSAAFATDGKLPSTDDPRQPRPANDASPSLAMAYDLGNVSAQAIRRQAMLAYDDGFSITYFRKALKPYWRRKGADAAGLLATAHAEADALRDRCVAFDRELMDDLARAGGEKYAQLAALAYRQAFAANKLVADGNGQPLMFAKENFSNGCIATVDVFYPMGPLLLLTSPALTRATLQPILAYSASERWAFPFAPHDLGTYPQANGQVYGGGERTEADQMPVEETGNMLLLLAALAKVEGNAEFVTPYWSQLRRWATYLETKGFDPENQLCTDDFSGHLAHNVNLSAKAILALAAFGQLCEARGEAVDGARYRDVARAMAVRWAKEADDGDHYRLAFDRPGTWSQKYNLVWDRLLGLGIFPPEVIAKELASYPPRMDPFGLPLDNRKPYAKLDWTVWTATMVADRAGFETLVNPIHKYLDQTSTRVQMADWYFTQDARQAGFQARSVVGGVFIKLLGDEATWKKYASRGQDHPKGWAPIPSPPLIREVIATARNHEASWRFTTHQPAAEWATPTFAAADWSDAPGGFGSAGTPGTSGALRTEWNTSDIWLRRQFQAPPVVGDAQLQLLVHHDEDAEVYLNGVLAAKLSSYTGDYEAVPIRPEARVALKPGAENILAVHCHQSTGGQFIDVGLATVQERSR